MFCLFFKGLVGHSPPWVNQPVRPVIGQQPLALSCLIKRRTRTQRKQRSPKMTWILSQAKARLRQQRVRSVTLHCKVKIVWSTSQDSKQVLCKCLMQSVYGAALRRHWLDSRLWRGELKGTRSRSGLCSMGHSTLPTSSHRRRGERVGQVHGLPAFLLVSLGLV